MIYLHKIRILIYANIYYTMVKSFRRKNVHRVRRKSARIHNNAKELGMMGAVLGFSALQTNSGSEHEGTAGAGAGAGAGAAGGNDGRCNGIVMGANTGGCVNTISGISNTSLIITCDAGLFASFCGTISAVM